MNRPNLILVGMSGSGKSATARILAQRLGLPLHDTDAMIETSVGKPIARIFADEGEDRFRDLERHAVEQACAHRGAVIATGGGAMAQLATRATLQRSGFIVALDAAPETLYARISSEQTAGDASTVRPLLQVEDPLAEIRRRKDQRQSSYALAHWTVHTDLLTTEEVADEVLRAWARYAHRLPRLAAPGVDEGDASGSLAAVVATPSENYPVYVEAGGLARLGERMRRVGLGGAVYVIADRNVAGHYGATAIASLQEAGFRAELHVIDAGETAKELQTVAGIYDVLVANRAERGHTLVALGGGVVGDMVGFAAATYLRGMPFVQAPTSLLAMVDASIGGKTAVNLAQGKNLVGAFYQPRLVLADTNTLATLPPRALTEGWAEAIKHALILDPALLATFERETGRLLRLEPGLTAAVVRRSAAIKAEVVSQDEKETGLRAVLNYGHTIGHALEAVSGYGQLLHGEAVAVGMHGAALISRGMGMLTAEDVARQQTLLRRFGLPETATGIDPHAVLDRLLLDKKVRDGRVRWVLLPEFGRAEVRNDVPASLVEDVVRRLVTA